MLKYHFKTKKQAVVYIKMKKNHFSKDYYYKLRYSLAWLSLKAL